VMLRGSYQVHVDVAELLCGYPYVLWWYLYMAVDLGPLAVQAGSHPGGDIIRESLSYAMRQRCRMLTVLFLGIDVHIVIIKRKKHILGPSRCYL
jgi:hypothetical protein